jgi:hypothetical protein
MLTAFILIACAKRGLRSDAGNAEKTMCGRSDGLRGRLTIQTFETQFREGSWPDFD